MVVFLRHFIRVWALLFVFLLLSGCGGGGTSGGSGGNNNGGGNNNSGGNNNGGGNTVTPVFNEWEKVAVDVSGQVLLPISSPIKLPDVHVEIYDSRKIPDGTGLLGLKVPEKQIAEAYIMLPEREGDLLPTIYQYTTILPGETDVKVSPEETAISLLMGRINQDLLYSAGTASQVKQMIRDSGSAFINQFVSAQDANPYLLNSQYFAELYTAEFENAADSCRAALKAAVVLSLSQKTMAQKPMLLSGSQLYVLPEATQHDFTVYEDTTGLFGVGSWVDLEDAGGKMTGQIKVENDTMLFAHVQVNDLLTGAAIQGLDFENSILGTISAAFHPNLLGPQKGWNRLWWAGTTNIDVDYKSSRVVVYTPAIAANDDASELEKRVGTGLAFRTGANALMNVVSNFVPLNEDGWKHWFIEMYDRGLLNAAMDKFAYGDIQGGIEELFWTFADGAVMEAFITDYLPKYLKNSLESKKITAQLLNKFNQVTKLVPISKIGLAIDVVKLADDLASTPGEIDFTRVQFPFNLADAAPSMIQKVAANDPLPVITITGMGLAPIFFDGKTYNPSVYLEAENLDGNPILYNIPEEELAFAGGGQSLSFELPREWAEIGSNVVGPIYLNVAHGFVDTHGIDEFIYLDLPHAEHESLFALSLDTNVVITGVSKTKPVRGEEITLLGQGFSPIASDNRVYFTDHFGTTLSAVVAMSTGTLIDLTVPEGLAIGPLTVEVELKDGSKSAKYPLALHPKSVIAIPGDKTHFESALMVSLEQEEGADIFYSIGGPDTDNSYSGPFLLEETTNIYPFAQVVVNGVEYKSAVSSYFYYKCAADEDFKDGVCIDNTPTSGIWKWSEQSSSINCDKRYSKQQSLGEWSANYQDSLTAEGSYTLPPAYFRPEDAVPFTASVTTTSTIEFAESYETVVFYRTTKEYPLDEDGDLPADQHSGTFGTVVSATTWGNDTASETGSLSLPKKGWVGWAHYLTITTGGGTVNNIGGCTLRMHNVYVWQE